MLEKVHNAVHLEGLLSYDPSLKRPGFRASEPEVKRFYDTYLPDVDVDALQDLDQDRKTLLVTAPYFLEYKEIEAALRALQKVIDKKNLNITVVFAAVWKSTSVSGAPDNSSRSPSSAKTRPCSPLCRRRVDGVISTQVVTVRQERARALPQNIFRRHLAHDQRKFLDPALGLVFVEQPDGLQSVARRHL